MISNCLIEALKAKIKDPKNIQLDYVSPKINQGHLHFVWINKQDETMHHFTTLKDNLPSFLDFLPFCGKEVTVKLDYYKRLILRKCYNNGFSIDETEAYIKKHHIQLTRSDVERYFEKRNN